MDWHRHLRWGAVMGSAVGLGGFLTSLTLSHVSAFEYGLWVGFGVATLLMTAYSLVRRDADTEQELAIMRTFHSPTRHTAPPWHLVEVRQDADGTWLLYDPCAHQGMPLAVGDVLYLVHAPLDTEVEA